jgi:uridine monophosphate synthetase
MVSFFEKIKQRSEAINSLLCVGLDPHIDDLSENSSKEVFIFCKHLIDQTNDIAVAYKPNIAFFEQFGAEGYTILQDIIQYIPNEIPVILDAKRGDINSTCKGYVTSTFDHLKADCITLNPYLGVDSISPFLNNKSKGCFVLCKTSNYSSNEIQSIKTKQNFKLYEHIALLINEWEHIYTDQLGLVVAANDKEALQNVRCLINDNIWILAPGLGAQGGDIEAAVQYGCNSKKTGILFPISRGISRAENPRKKAIEFRDTINKIRTHIDISNINYYDKRKEFIEFILSKQVLQYGSFTLKSGLKSSYFFNMGMINKGVDLIRLGDFYANRIIESGIEFDVLFGPAYKGIPLATLTSISLSNIVNNINKGIAYNRKEIKTHGEKKLLVGEKINNKKILIIDDVITAGTAITETIDLVTKHKGIVVGVIVALDRQEIQDNEYVSDKLQKKYNIPIISISTYSDLSI